MNRNAPGYGRRGRTLAAAAILVSIAFPHAVFAQTRLSLGAGGGVAGSTDASLSEGHSGLTFTGQLTHGVLPFVGLGAEVNHWTRSGTNLTFATAILQVHIPLTGLLVKAGAGYGGGNPDGLATVHGVAGQLGLAYDLTLPGAPIALTVFGNGAVAYASSRCLQLVAAGLALTFR